jgi:hypothetical protein
MWTYLCNFHYIGWWGFGFEGDVLASGFGFYHVARVD